MLEAKYQEYWKKRIDREKKLEKEREKKAWEVVDKVVTCLREEFGAGKCIVFGSLVRDRCFRPDSDLDLAIADLPPHLFYKALARVNQNHEFWIDLKPLEDLEPHFLQRIQDTGIDYDKSRNDRGSAC